MSITNTEIVEALSSKTIMEVVELIELIESKFGVSAAAAVAQSATEVPVVEEQTEFEVILKGIGEGTNKVVVIKAIRAVTGLGLIESKTLVETTPAVVKSQVSKEEAETIKKQLLEAGGVVEVK